MINLENFLLYVWQLPQNLLGLLAFRRYRDSGTRDTECLWAKVRYSKRMKGGVSLGLYIIVNTKATPETLRHELGHSRQSRILGWLYLPMVGIQSFTHWMLHRGCCRERDYHHFWTERWADRLGRTVFGSEASQTPFE